MSETPEDVALLYSWANLQGARYRDFSASRREYRAQTRHHAAEEQRAVAQRALDEAQRIALATEGEARVAEEAAHFHEAARKLAERSAGPEMVEMEEAARRRAVAHAEELHRRAAEERATAARHADAMAAADASARRESREMIEARASAARQAARYEDSEERRRALAGPQPTTGSVGNPPMDPSDEEDMGRTAAATPTAVTGAERGIVPEDDMMPVRFPQTRNVRQLLSATLRSEVNGAKSARERGETSKGGERRHGDSMGSGGTPERHGATGWEGRDRRMPMSAEPPADQFSGHGPAGGETRTAGEGERIESGERRNGVPGQAQAARGSYVPEPESTIAAGAPLADETEVEASARDSALEASSREMARVMAEKAGVAARRRGFQPDEPSRTFSLAPGGTEGGGGETDGGTMPRGGESGFGGSPGTERGGGRAMGERQGERRMEDRSPFGIAGEGSSGAWGPGRRTDTVPAWIASPGRGRRAEDRVEPSYARAAAEPAEGTLQGSRERVAARWFALKGVFGGAENAAEAENSPPKDRRAPLVAVYSPAGGVGKTTLVATLGRALSASGEKVLLVDATSQGLLPYFFGARELRTGAVRRFSPPPGSLDAPIAMLGVDLPGKAQEDGGDEWLAEELNRHGRGLHRTLVDLGVGAGAVVRRLARVSATVLVPLTADMNSVLAVNAVEKLLSGLVDAEGRSAEPFYVLNQFDASLPLHLDVREVLKQQLGDRLLSLVVRRSGAVPEAVAEGMTVMDYAPEAGVAGDAMNLASWLRTQAAPATGGGLGQARWSER